MQKIFKFKYAFLIFSLFISSLMMSVSEASSLQMSPIIIFVSFSMPKQSLKNWMRDAEKIHAPVVIRGLINNSFKETTKSMMELTKDNHGGVQLDPTVFEYFHIDKVPAVVVTTNAACSQHQSCPENYDVIYGDVTLRFALQKIADQNDSVSMIALNALKEFKTK